jgi:glycine/D-amino acid oxidase-like deaminating enzyme
MHELSHLTLWHGTMSDDDWGPGRPAITGDIDADVAIIGAGYTGMWTAYYLLQRDPSLRVVLLEANVVGFGASGRNGGWCSALLPMGLDAIAAESSRDEAVRLQREMFDTVGEVARVVAAEGIDCHWQQGGWVALARNELQMARMRAEVEHQRSYGFGEHDHRLLDRAEAAAMCNATDVVGGMFTPHCAAIHPARLARGLARVVERMGATILEHSPVTSIAPHEARTPNGVVRARTVVRATEAFTASLKGQARAVVPIYSLMIATEPLPDDVWARIGLHDRPTFNDGRRMIVYGQRTADGRFAFGGRGTPYHFGSRIRPGYDRNDGVHRLLHDTLREMFPAIGDADITHRWGGPVGAARDWWCSAHYDAATGLASAGAYVGDGVGTTNLSGRTLADLISGERTPLTTLPWVGHRSRRWEPEPLRWIGINGMVRLPIGIDKKESTTGKASRLRAAVVDRLTGH